MTEKPHNPHHDELDQAMRQRLARLGTMPVDTSALDRMLRAKLPPAPQVRRTSAWRPWIAPLRAAAAVAAVLLAIIGVLVLSAGRPVMASPSLMAQMHRDLVAERVAAVRVDSIEQASAVLAEEWQNKPPLPAAPDAHVMACCMREVKDKRVACILLRTENVPVTMTVARAADMKLPRGPTIARDGVTYHISQVEELTMVMAERHGRWVCLISELPAERLVEIAARLKF